MPFCPKCRYEYEAGVAVCPDCQVELTAELPPEPEQADEPLVELRSLPGKIYADMVKEALEKQGIPCVVKPEVLSGGLLVSGDTGECRIFVAARHKRRAEKILTDMMDHI